MSYDPMEYIWERSAETGPDGQKVAIYSGDFELDSLYQSGFVDTEKYTLDEWHRAFADSKQPDGSYRVTHGQWIAKRPYRYAKTIQEPFDPYKIADGDYTPAQMKILLREGIIPSTLLKENDLPKLLEAMQTQAGIADGKIRYDARLKRELAFLLERFPSPLRRMELRVQKIRQKKKGAATRFQLQQAKSLFKTEASHDEVASQKIEKIVQAKSSTPSTSPPKKGAIPLATELRKRQRHPKV